MAAGSRVVLAALLSVVVSIAPLRAQAAELAKLTVSDGVPLPTTFGSAVSVWGDRALVGALEDAGAGLTAWVVYVFERAPKGGWRQTGKFTASNGAALYMFSVTVSLGEDRALVGALFSNGTDGTPGGAWVFERAPSGNWDLVDELHPADLGQGELGHGFGWDVALEGDRALIGAGYDATPPNDYSGAAYVFERQADGHWSQVAKIKPTNIYGFALAGASVALSGDTALIGAPWDDPSGLCELIGSAFVYQRNSSGLWLQTGKLVTDDWECHGNFGSGLALSGNQALVGWGSADTPGTDQGCVYVYEQVSPAGWTLSAKITPHDAQAGDHFGSLAAFGNRLIVGAYGHRQGSGTVYVFEKDAHDQWVELSSFEPGAVQAGDMFGGPVAIWHDRVLVRASHSRGSDDGTVYVFDIEPLSSDVKAISAMTGGTQPLALDAGQLHANEPYLLLGSLAGASPGIPIGAGFVLPLNLDHYLVWTYANPNTPPLSGSVGVLSAAGSASAAFTLPAGFPALAGLTVWHAFVTRDPATGNISYVSNAVQLSLVP